ncbi:MAG: hypothetical protein QOF76_2187 [Solirubrobacteraceae bacterium]|jgi:hypothetical protein|nr:hypothetical protein [Solirubrobacteraceae bacterium]
MLKQTTLIPVIYLACCSAAAAATPEQGAVGLQAPLTWTGHITEQTGTFEEAAFAAQSTLGMCHPPVCDVFTLEVPDDVGSLYVDVTGAGARTVAFELIDPSGEATCVDDGVDSPTRSSDSENPRGGTWTVQILGTGDFDYTATAHLAKVAGGTVPTELALLSPVARGDGGVGIPLTTNQAVTNVRARLTRKGKTVATVRRANVAERATLKFAGPLKRGRYTLDVTATSPDGSPATVHRTFRIR